MQPRGGLIPLARFFASACLAVFSVSAAPAAESVTITAADSEAAETGCYPGVYRIVRSGGDTSQPLQVGLAFSGTAVAGSDYEPLPQSVIIPAGQATVDLTLDPINDPDVEVSTTDTAIATIQPGAGYTVGSPGAATINIADNETFTNTAPLAYAAEAISATSIVLRWTDNFETESKYRVQYRAEGTATWSSTDADANSTSKQITGLIPGQAYEFRVIACAADGTTVSLSPNPIRQVALDPGTPPPFTTFEQWRKARGLDGALRGDYGRTTDDPDGDGQNNLLEYVLGGDPLAGDSAGLAVAPASPASIFLQWPENPAILDAWPVLQESAAFARWDDSSLPSSASAGVRFATDTRGGNARYYRLRAATAEAENPSATITCWGDSLTATSPGYPSKLATALGRTVQNCGIGGDTSIQIMDRMRGLQITAPRPATAVGTAAGTPVRIVASRTVHARIMNTGYRSSWATYSSTIANVTKVEFFNRSVKIGESSTPLSASVTSNKSYNPKRLIAAGHPFANGDVVHFPSGALPSPLVAGKTYYVRDADAGGFSLAEDESFVSITASTSAPSTVFTCAGHPFADGDQVWFPATPLPGPLVVGRTYYVRDAGAGIFSLAETPGGTAITMTSNLSSVDIKGPPRAALSLAADFAAPTTIQGPFVLDWTHPGGPTSLSIRTLTDRDANTFVFWMGRNNSARPHEIYADIHAAVEHIKSLNGRFLIMGVLTASTEPIGNNYYYPAININNLLRREFPNEFIDIRKELILSGQATGQDAIDRAADMTPSSLRSDTLHLNDAGYQVVADILAREIARRGW